MTKRDKHMTSNRPYYYLIGYNIEEQCYEELHGSYSRKECEEEKRDTDWYDYKRLVIKRHLDATPLADVLAIHASQ